MSVLQLSICKFSSLHLPPLRSLTFLNLVFFRSPPPHDLEHLPISHELQSQSIFTAKLISLMIILEMIKMCESSIKTETHLYLNQKLTFTIVARFFAFLLYYQILSKLLHLVCAANWHDFFKPLITVFLQPSCQFCTRILLQTDAFKTQEPHKYVFYAPYEKDISCIGVQMYIYKHNTISL